jgi:hypothetical protein
MCYEMEPLVDDRKYSNVIGFQENVPLVIIAHRHLYNVHAVKHLILTV